MSSNVREVSEEDQIKVPRIRKPRLHFKLTIYGDLKVRLHPNDRRHIPALYDFLSDFGEDVLQKKDEFDLQRWILIPSHRKGALKQRFSLVPYKKD